jgi:adenylate cyclase
VKLFRLTPRLAGLIAALAMAALIQSIGPESVRRPVFDLWQQLAPRDLSKTDVRIVWIDDLSLRKYGAWPWPRQLMAALTREVGEAGAKVIGFDVLFPEADRVTPDNVAGIYPRLSAAAREELRAQPSTDQEFANIIGLYPVVLGRAGVDAGQAPKPDETPVEAQFAKPLPADIRSWPSATSNILEIDFVGQGHGLLNGDPDDDGIVRRVPLAAKVGGIDMPGFALELARIFHGETVIGQELREGSLLALRLGGTRLPVDPDGGMRLRLGTMPDGSEYSAIDILDGSARMEGLRGKAVIVALKGAGTADLVATPLERSGYGATVQANALDTVLTGRGAVVRPYWAWIIEGALAVLLVVLAIRVLPRQRVGYAAMGQGAVLMLIFAASFFVFAGFGWQIDVLAPVLVAGATSFIMMGMLFAQSRAQEAALAAALQEQKLTAARAQGELDAAREIQLGMLPPREALAALDARVEVDAFVEPARSVGGDFYDAVRIDERRICFLVGDVTGKGVPAALFMALSKALTKSVLLRDGNDLAAAVTRLNDEIARDNSEDMFVTMIVGVLDVESGALSLCNAGHEHPWLLRADGSAERLDPDGGPPLAVAPGFPYGADVLQLDPGDAILFLSDGVTEAQDPDGKFFGSQRVAAIAERLKGKGAAPLAPAILEEVRLFEAGAEATDDLTVLAFARRAT